MRRRSIGEPSRRLSGTAETREAAMAAFREAFDAAAPDLDRWRAHMRQMEAHDAAWRGRRGLRGPADTQKGPAAAVSDDGASIASDGDQPGGASDPA